MTTPTEDHWAQLSGADLVAELREMGESVLDPLTPVEARAAAAIMRAAEVIEAQRRAIGDLTVRVAVANWSYEDRVREIEAQADNGRVAALYESKLRGWIDDDDERHGRA